MCGCVSCNSLTNHFGQKKKLKSSDESLPIYVHPNYKEPDWSIIRRLFCFCCKTNEVKQKTNDIPMQQTPTPPYVENMGPNQTANVQSVDSEV